MSADILNVNERINFDDNIVSKELHTYQPYASNLLNNNDEIRISVQRQDLFTLPSESLIYIEGQLLKENNTPSTHAKFINNGILHLFDEIRYEVGGIVIDRIRNPGVTTTLKGYISYSINESLLLENAGWSANSLTLDDLLDANGNFTVCIPLRMVLGFAEDFKKIVMNLRQDLVLLRSNTDLNALVSTVDTEKLKVNLTKVQWRIPHVSVSDQNKLTLIKYLENSIELKMPFRAWELHEYPVIPATETHTWVVKTATQLEKPRFIIFGFQTDLKNKVLKNMSEFHHCNLTNIKVELNSEVYPYDNLNLNFKNNHWSLLYHMYAQFQSHYYQKANEPIFEPKKFKTICPIAVINTSHQNESLKSGAVDLKISFETSQNIPANTHAYCLILYDKIVKYSPLTNSVRLM